MPRLRRSCRSSAGLSSSMRPPVADHPAVDRADARAGATASIGARGVGRLLVVAGAVGERAPGRSSAGEARAAQAAPQLARARARGGARAARAAARARPARSGPSGATSVPLEQLDVEVADRAGEPLRPLELGAQRGRAARVGHVLELAQHRAGSADRRRAGRGGTPCRRRRACPGGSPRRSELLEHVGGGRVGARPRAELDLAASTTRRRVAADRADRLVVQRLGGLEAEPVAEHPQRPLVVGVVAEHGRTETRGASGTRPASATASGARSRAARPTSRRRRARERLHLLRTRTTAERAHPEHAGEPLAHRRRTAARGPSVARRPTSARRTGAPGSCTLSPSRGAPAGARPQALRAQAAVEAVEEERSAVRRGRRRAQPRPSSSTAARVERSGQEQFDGRRHGAECSTPYDRPTLGCRDRAQVPGPERVPDGPPHAGERIEQGYLAIAPDGVEVRIRRRAGRAHPHRQVRAGRGPHGSGAPDPRRRNSSALAAHRPAGGSPRRGAPIRPSPTRWSPRSTSTRSPTQSLLVAEIEFASVEDSERFAPPAWLGREIHGRRAIREPVARTRGPPAGRRLSNVRPAAPNVRPARRAAPKRSVSFA